MHAQNLVAGVWRSRFGKLRLACLVLAVPGVLLIGAAGPALGATPSLDASGCASSSQGVSVHFDLARSGATPGISGVQLSGFDAGQCDGQPVEVTLFGNQAGNTPADPSELLSTLDSSLDPCSGKSAAAPVLIHSGAVSLHGCAHVKSGSGAAFASVHDLTRLTVSVAGHQVQTRPPEVLGTEAFANGSGGSGMPGTVVSGPSFAGLPLTGGPHSWLFWVGVLLVLFGFGSLLVDRFKTTRAMTFGTIPGRRRNS
jgi:hypothetical protein